MADVEAAKPSDLGIRTVTAAAMLVVAGLAMWLGGWWWNGFVIAIGMGVISEWVSLAFGFAKGSVSKVVWSLAGVLYVAIAGIALVYLRSDGGGYWLVALVLAVIGTDIGAYFAGRAIGGPKIAPKISPSKTWAGLGGGVIGAYVALLAHDAVFTAWLFEAQGEDGGVGALSALEANWSWMLLLAAIVACTAQAGDFFESWMKRRAGVKDSGTLLPGHGGLFDRVDGLLGISFIVGVYVLAASWGLV